MNKRRNVKNQSVALTIKRVANPTTYNAAGGVSGGG
jgi:hypothetical protein